MDVYPKDRLVQENWMEPADNWLQYFIDGQKFEDILNNSASNKELLATLTIQFAEQATNTEAEEKALLAKNFPPEDVQYYSRKSACLWLCSMACFAAIKWDYVYLMENYDFLTVKPIVEYVKRMFNDYELTADATFGNWLWDKFCLAVLVKNRVPPPFPKQTVQNPNIKTSPDMVILRYEANARAIAELQIHLSKYVQAIEGQAKEGTTIYVPGWKCFHEPFKNGAGKALNIGILGQDVLVLGAPKPQLSLQINMISTEEVGNRARFDMTVYYFDDEKQAKSCTEYMKTVKDGGSHMLINVDPSLAAGYRLALGIAKKAAEKKLDHAAPRRKFSIKRTQQHAEADESTKMTNLACQVIEQKPVLIRQQISNSEFFLQSLQIQLRYTKSELERRRVLALLYYFCATIAGFREQYERLGLPAEWRRGIVTGAPRIPTCSFIKEIVKALVTGQSYWNPYWAMITSFIVEEVATAVKTLQTPPSSRSRLFRIPVRFRYPEVLAEYVGNATRPVIELNAVLLGKTSQLSSMHNFAEWDRFASELPGIIGAEMGAKLLLEATNVRNCYYNHKIHLACESFDAKMFLQQQQVVKGKFAQICLAYPQLTKQTLAFLLNTKEFEYLVKIELTHPLVVAAKLLAAFGTRGGHLDATMAEFLAVWLKYIKPLLENKQAPRRDREMAAYRENIKLRAEFVSFIKLIREPSLLLFLISFFAHLYNSLLVSDKKPHMKLFVQQTALFPADYELIQPHVETIAECLGFLLEVGLDINPCNAFWIRTDADFKYSRNDIEEAAVEYVEAVLACCPNGCPPFPDNVIDDTLWSRLRICLNRMNQHTMAALVCQPMRKRGEDYIKAAKILTNQTTLDAGSECLSMLWDLGLAEELGSVYVRLKQTNQLARLQRWISKGSLHPNNRVEIQLREQNRRCEQLVRTLAASLFNINL